MKKFAVFIILCLFLVGCSDLPPEPKLFGGVGKATSALPDWAADPGNKFSMGQGRVMMQGGVGKVKAKVAGDQYVYQKGYVYMNGNWELFSFIEDSFEGSNWVAGTANADIAVTQDQMPEGKYYMVAYSCSKVAGLWECNGNKWMLQSFDVAHGECTAGEKKCVSETAYTFCGEDNMWTSLPDSPCEFGETCTDGVCSSTGGASELTVTTCQDNIKNQDETDIDCGGVCDKCVDGKTCAVVNDCISINCVSGICTALPTCSDGIKNQDEAAIDCGGVCDGCSIDSDCSVSGDCLSAYCGQGVCKTYFECIDSDAGQKFDVKGSATGVSFEITTAAQYDDVCSGSQLTEYYCLGNDVAQVNETCQYGCNDGICMPQPVCNDSIKNQDETDVDCGGVCGKCVNGKTCFVATDCTSNYCLGGVCLALPTCFDGIKNQDETAIDCGGSCAANCANGKVCITNNDCVSTNCASGICKVLETCFDGIKNQDETATDCGGSCAANCAVGQTCSSANDCTTNKCTSGVCQSKIYFWKSMGQKTLGLRYGWGCNTITTNIACGASTIGKGVATKTTYVIPPTGGWTGADDVLNQMVFGYDQILKKGIYYYAGKTASINGANAQISGMGPGFDYACSSYTTNPVLQNNVNYWECVYE